MQPLDSSSRFVSTNVTTKLSSFNNIKRTEWNSRLCPRARVFGGITYRAALWPPAPGEAIVVEGQLDPLVAAHVVAPVTLPVAPTADPQHRVTARGGGPNVPLGATGKIHGGDKFACPGLA